MEVSHEAREAVAAARNDAGYAHQMAEGRAEVLNGLSTKGVEVDSAAFMFLGEGTRVIADRLLECDARLGEAVGAISAPGMP